MIEKWNKKDKIRLGGVWKKVEEGCRQRSAGREAEAEERRGKGGKVCQREDGGEEKERGEEKKQKTRHNYKEHESRKCQVTAGDSVGEPGEEGEQSQGRVEIKGAIMEAEGVTHTWKMVFWSPTTSPSPTVRVS